MRAPAASPASAADPRLRDAVRALEGLVLRQIVRASGAFADAGGTGAGVHADLFVDALADAVARAGGIGLADALSGSLAPAGATRPLEAPATPLVDVLAGPAPVAGPVTSGFGARTDPFTGVPARHAGLDVAAPEGATIVVPAAGVVRAAGPRGGYGNAVEIDHGGGVVTLFAHTSELLVAPGEAVAPGQEIARVGRSGRATGPHLHLEVRLGGRPVDPLRALKAYAARAEGPRRSGP